MGTQDWCRQEEDLATLMSYLTVDFGLRVVRERFFLSGYEVVLDKTSVTSACNTCMHDILDKHCVSKRCFKS